MNETLQNTQELVQQISELEAKAADGILNRDAAHSCLKEIRSGLFDLMKIIRKEPTIGSDAPDPEGPAAA